jgi:ribosomal protein S12 methylthiotransferase accessory factor
MSVDFGLFQSRHSDHLCGFFSELRVRQETSGPYYGLWIAGTDLGDVTRSHNAPMSSRGVTGLSGFGTAFERQTAECRALAEAVERFCSVMFPTDAVIQSSGAALGPDALLAEAFPQCSRGEREIWQADVGLRAVNSDSVLSWVEAWSVTHGRRRFIPLEMAFMGMPTMMKDLIALPVSTGFAAGSDYEMAVQNGLLEVVERDAVALWWWGRRRRPHLAAAAFENVHLSGFEERAKECRLKAIYLDLTTDVGIPVVGALQLQASFPHVVFMSASRFSLSGAALRALEETGSVRQALATADQAFDEKTLLSGHPHDPANFAMFYAQGRRPSAFDFALATSERQQTAAVSDFSAAVARLADLGHEVIVVDCTTDEAEALGLAVVHVVVPGLMGISFSHSVRYLGESRFRSVCAIPEQTDGLEAANHDPLPFA